MNTLSLKTHLRDDLLKKGLILSAIALFAFSPSGRAAEVTPSELLERGIYSEETKGDIDGAMRLYQQIVAEVGANQALAAHAQFRLALCYDKKKDYPAATAAFEKLIHDFPNQKELVTLANDYLAEGTAFLPVPWTSGEELSYQLKFPAGAKIGIGRFTVDADEINGRKIWRFGSQVNVGIQQWSRVEVDAESFKPIHSRWRHTMIGEADTTYSSSGADLKMKGSNDVKHINLNGAVYDNEQAIQLMRRLPLTTGYSTQLSLFIGLGGGAVMPIKLDVGGLESVEVPAGKFECYKVALSIGQTFWYSTDGRRSLVKFEAGGVIAELLEARQRVAGERLLIRDPLFGFSFQTPPDVLAKRIEKNDNTLYSTYSLLDPAGLAWMNVKVEKLARFDEKARASLRAFAEYKIGQGTKFTKKFTLRPDAWRDITIDGQPGLLLVADIEEGDKAYVLSAAYSFIEGNAVEFTYWSAPDAFEAFGPTYTAVIDSYRAH